MKEQLYCGAAIGNISPDEKLYPIAQTFAGPNGFRPIHFVGMLDQLDLRVLAIKCGKSSAMIITFDLGQIPADDGDKFLDEIAVYTKIPRENIIIVADHVHAAPYMGEDKITSDYIREHGIDEPTFESNQKAMNGKMRKSLFAAIDQALSSMKPARLGIGYGKSYINVNRNQKFTDKWGKGARWEGPSDKTLAVIRFETLEGQPIAFLTNYAVHADVMFENKCLPGGIGISSDIPGMVSTWMEKKYEGAVALWTSGAAGDQNPIFMNSYTYPDPITGACKKGIIEGGNYDWLKVLSARHLADIEEINSKIECTIDSVSIFGEEKDAVCPGGKTLTEDPDNVFSKVVGWEDGEDFRLHLKLLRIGDIALCAAGAELYSSLGSYMKEKSPLKNTIIMNLSIRNKKYILDDEALENGCIASGEAAYKKGYIKEALAEALTAMIQKSCEG